MVKKRYMILREQGLLMSGPAEELETRVSKFLAAGWKLAGGLSVISSVHQNGYTLCQAIYKED